MWGPFVEMAELNMRLMCLDSEVGYHSGWAAIGARLYDEVFSIPGCGSPVILRLNGQGQYRLIGHAIVLGIMDNELWLKTKPEDLVQIEIA
jgi:hypothetical protein